MKVIVRIVLGAAIAGVTAMPLRAEWLPISIVQQASRQHCLPAVIVFGHDYCPYTQPALDAHDADATSAGGAGILRAYVDVLSPEGAKLAESWCTTVATQAAGLTARIKGLAH